MDGSNNGQVAEKTAGAKDMNRSLRDGCKEVSAESKGTRADKANERQPRKETTKRELAVQAAEGIQKEKVIRRKGLVEA